MLAHHALGAVAVLGEDQAEHAVVLAVGRLAFPELRTEIEEIVEDGDRPAIRWRSTGRHTGAFLGVPPTGAGGGGRSCGCEAARSCPVRVRRSRWRPPGPRRNGNSWGVDADDAVRHLGRGLQVGRLMCAGRERNVHGGVATHGGH
ncbi:ester cyclase [Actinacidiphila oryziradicis]|uniref:ester cyclase n=1 Tax=Actinacidiphila oryziradicis TaxID=2571141 RepID=UPI001FE90851|nr:ester cyclase [Actinacidiphila oryziradicis]